MLRRWEGWGGVGHVNVMLMLRWCYVDGRGGVGWGMLTSCSCYVDATLMGGRALWLYVYVCVSVFWCIYILFETWLLCFCWTAGSVLSGVGLRCRNPEIAWCQRKPAWPSMCKTDVNLVECLKQTQLVWERQGYGTQPRCATSSASVCCREAVAESTCTTSVSRLQITQVEVYAS